MTNSCWLQVALGMKHLEEQKFIQVNVTRSCTIFTGPSSMEMVVFRISARSSDSPYPDIPTPLALVSRLSTGYRMSRPHQCSEELYTLMRSCWNEDPLMRPSFADIVDQLAYFLREVKRIYINITEDEISGTWPRNDHQLYPRKWTKYIQWYDPQGSPVGDKCLQSTPRVKELHCILMLKRLTMEQFGNYTCEAQNDYGGYCTQKVVEIELQASLAPEIVEDPKNQTVDAGFNATFDCAAKGHPMPSITWIKNDDALAVQSNNWTRVAEIFLDDEQSHSKLVIKGVKREDDGKYYCFANNSAGEKTSKPAFLSTKDLVVENNNMQLNKKKHTHDDWRVESIPRVSSEERTPTPLDVGDKHFPNSIFDQKGYAEELFNSRNGHQSAEEGCSHCDVNIISYQDSGMESDKDSDEIQTSLFIEIEESEKDRGTLEVLDEVLGEGEYGIVYKGRYGERNGSTTDVAVKKLKGNACTLAKAALLNEIRTLKQAGRHPNIVNLIGTWVQGETILVVTELVHGGSLESFLRCKGDGSNEYANVHCKLNDRQLLKIALQVALGMNHLEEQKCIHRDLAARNVLIGPNMVAKVGDFGLAREITEDGLYIKTSYAKVPWRWSSLESLRDRVYTSKRGFV
ncbi:hypothetical protein pdam_00018076 [Pocillopora damicornis]|uniref:receptor protein-tyrosine kinase n=1 Tax=Pocillopora damicornis TaxID=46731 RepID=A0A3M6V611_POCDA|nr:hypothetical protein pdam_00018076 [Pocillopora damicornis]